MTSLVLWVPGTLLIIIGAMLLAFGQIDLSIALAVIGIGVALETAGTLVWIRQRKPPD